MTAQLIKINARSNQDAFDKVVRHLASMRQRAMILDENTGTICMYETPEKEHCAIGALLVLDTPEKHAWAQEAKGDVESVLYDPEYPEYMPQDGFSIDPGDFDPCFLAGLQGLHDAPANWGDDGFEGWDDLLDFAVDYGLETEVVNAARR